MAQSNQEFTQMYVPEFKLTQVADINLEKLTNITSSSSAVQVLSQFIAQKGLTEQINVNEFVFILYLNKRNKVIAVTNLAIGGIDMTVMDVRLVFGLGLKCGASAIIVAHNHPTGNLQPSEADKQIGRRIKEVGVLLQINALDFLIITSNNGYYSFADNSEYAHGGMMADGGITDDEGNVINIKVGDEVVEYRKRFPNAEEKTQIGPQGRIIKIVDAMAKVSYLNDYEEWIALRYLKKISHNKMAHGGMMADGGEIQFVGITDDEGNLIDIKVGDEVVQYKKRYTNQEKEQLGGKGRVISINGGFAKVSYGNDYEQWVVLGELKKMANGGMMAKGGDLFGDMEGVDLFEDYEDQPQEVQRILSKYEIEDNNYDVLQNLKAELEAIGYTMDFGLDAEPYDLRKIGQVGKSEFMAKGGITEHGLRVGDTIVSEIDANTIVVDNAVSGRRTINISTGQSMAKGGMSDKIVILVKDKKGNVVLRTTSTNKAADYCGLHGRENFTVETLDGRRIMAKGGRMGFKALSQKVASHYAGKSVPAKYQPEYGKFYDADEADTVGNKVAAKVYRLQQGK